MRTLLLVGVAATALVGAAGTANADIYRTFTGTPTSPSYPGPSGYLEPVTPSEPWVYGSGTPILNATGAPTTDLGWGSPGVSLGLTPSNEHTSVTDFEITFGVGATIDPAQVALGAVSDCAGSEGSRTSSAAPTLPAPSSRENISYDANSISFAGPDMAFGADYFVNVMLTEGSIPVPFYGAWTFAPEPSRPRRARRRPRRARHNETPPPQSL